MSRRAAWLGACATLAFAPAIQAKSPDTEMVAIYSSVTPGYTRSHLPDGSLKAETYAFGEGGLEGGNSKDATLDQLRFRDVVRRVAPALAGAHYIPCDRSKPRDTDLLIMVYWGATVGTDGVSNSPEYQIAQSIIPPTTPAAQQQALNAIHAQNSMSSGPGSRDMELAVGRAQQDNYDSSMDQALMMTQAANEQRDRQDFHNAAVLGFLPDIKDHEELPPGFTSHHQDLIDEVEQSRYYVVLKAYDFQAMLRHKDKRLLWETRFSIPQRNNSFNNQLAFMAQTASRYFGQTTHGVQHGVIKEGSVDVGDIKVLGEAQDKK